MEPMCKVTYDNGQINYVAPIIGTADINEVVKNDQSYGKMVPRNGKYFTWKLLGAHDEELSEKQFLRAITLAWQHWEKRVDFPIQMARKDEIPDFKVLVRTVDTDERGELTNSTIMYHYFPINNFDHKLRGLCVVNSGFYYTVHGRSVSMHEIDPVNYPNDTNAMGRTIDIDQVFIHEFGHGIGLPHDPEGGNVMSSNYGIMADFPTERDVYRAVVKYGVPKQKPRWFSRWWNYLRHRPDRY